MIHHEGTKGTKDTKVRAMGVSHAVVGAAIEVHKLLGPGLLESIYEAALDQELRLQGLWVDRQVSVPLLYKGCPLELRARLDLIVEKLVVVEVKAVARLLPIHRSQLLTYLRLTNHTVGLLINFNVELLRHGVRRVLNG
jgi:GxxExxY protein